jgi:glycosyltransferase involved in cell wall biosynthesis
MKKLCFITRSSLGDSPYADIALPALAEDGWQIDVWASQATRSVLNQVRPYRARFFDLHDEPGGGGAGHELRVLRALCRARWSDYDVVYINSQSLSARAYFALWGMTGKKLVYHNPDFYDPGTHPLHAWLERGFTRKADLYINNEFHRGYITSSFYGVGCPVLTAPPNLPACWPIAAPSSAKRAEMCAGSGEQRPFVLMLHGSFSEIRMVPQLFQALALLPERFRLVMTNADHRRQEADALMQRLGIVQRVVRLPRCSFSEMLAYSVNADAGILFYQNNDLGNFFTAPGRLTEYLACGLPVIGTNHTGLENLLLRFRLGVSVDTTDPRRIATGLLELERGVKHGRYRFNRRKFLRYFAFDRWEPGLVAAVNAMAFPSSGNIATRRPVFPWLPSS